MKSGVGVLVLGLFAITVFSQPQFIEIRDAKPEDKTVCYAKDHNEHTYVAPPKSFYDWKANQNARTKTANFEVTYIGFSSEAKNAFQAAVDIWSTLITSDITIRITANWEPLTSGVLGSASSGGFIRNFAGAQRQQVWYPVALAEKVSGINFNGTNADIEASFNSNNNSWYYGTSGGASAGTYDLVSIVLHEIGHGLGINHNYAVEGSNGVIANGDFVFTFNSYIESTSGQNIVSSFTTPSTELRTQLTGNSLFLNSPLVLTANSNARAKIYAPSTFSAGSSIAHLDENTYTAGDPNSLMTPQIGFAEVIHNPGPIILGILNDMGWRRTLIQHTSLLNTETINVPYEIKCTIKSDNGYDASSVKLHYSTNENMFTTVPMSSTGVANEFTANLPNTGSTIKYFYYMTVIDNDSREMVRPGKTFRQGQAARQSSFQFEAGPDTQSPKIVHDAKQFLVDTDAQLPIKAVVSDNIGLQDVIIEYLINDVAQPAITMTLIDPKEDSVYDASITFSPLLTIGGNVKYRIKATDNSIARNVKYIPSATTYFELPVTGLLPVQNSYSNNFNSPTTDFFGDNLFSIQQPSGFADGAIHSQHPYPNGSGPNNESNFTYQLKVPVRVKSSDAFIRFEEIVLVEPSEAGAAFGTADFFDYVIVEGSKDGGITWKKLLDGYNSRSQSTWLSKFNSAKDSEAQPNSTAAGDPTLFRSRQINLLAQGNFAAGDEVAIRFRLFADQLVHGWGWAIDNLRIQVDDVPPEVLHDHLNYQWKENPIFNITTKVTDANGLASLAVDYQINNQPSTTFDFPITSGTSEYTLSQTVNGLAVGDVFKYKIRAKDAAGNERVLPERDYFLVPVIEMNAAVSQYVSDFNSANIDFVGNFFQVSQPTGFNSGLLQTVHPYPLGFGLNKTSNLITLLKSPIIVSDSNPFISYDEVALVEPGDQAIADYVLIEASKDNGTTWEAVVEPYNASSNSTWSNAFNGNETGAQALLKTRLVDLTGNGKFKAGDKVLIRLRLLTNATTNGWGWAIDNLSIQGPVTGLEKQQINRVSIFPNPAENGKITVELSGGEMDRTFQLSFFNAQGALMHTEEIQTGGDGFRKEYATSWASGLYILRIEGQHQVTVKKFVVR